MLSRAKSVNVRFSCKNLTLADLLYLEYIRDNKIIIYHLKRVFSGVCIEKGARSFVGKNGSM